MTETKEKIALSKWLAMPLHEPALITNSKGEHVDYEQILSKYEKVLEHVHEISNQLIQEYHEEAFQVIREPNGKGKGKHGEVAARKIFADIPVPDAYRGASRVKMLAIKLAWGSLESWAEREKVYRWIKANPNGSYEKYNDYSYYYQGHRIKQMFFKNIEECVNNGNKNTLPVLSKGKLFLSDVDKQYVKLKQEKDFLVLETIILDEWYTLYFPIPDYMQGKIMGVSKPTIEIVKGKLTFGYSVKTRAPIMKPKNEKYLSVDLGVNKAFTAIVMSGENKVSAPLVCSYGLETRWDRLKTYGYLVNRLNKKLKRHKEQNIIKNTTITERTRLINARQRQKHDLHYLIAKDVIAHAIAHNCSTIVIEDLRWAKNWRFANTLAAIKHVATRNGINVKEVNPAKSSRTCPECNSTKVTHPIYSMTKCTKCGWFGNRDYAAAIVLAKTARQKKTKKLTIESHYRPRKPSVKIRKTIARYNNHQRTKAVHAGTPTTLNWRGANTQQKTLPIPLQE